MKFNIYYLEEKGKVVVSYRMMDLPSFLSSLDKGTERKLGPFRITKEDCEEAKALEEYGDLDTCLDFCLGHLEDDHYIIPGRVIASEHNLIIDKDCPIDTSMLFNKEGINPCKVLFSMLDQDIHIGMGDGCIRPETISEILHKCPTETEVKYYVESRIGDIVSEQLELEDDYQKKYEDYLKS